MTKSKKNQAASLPVQKQAPAQKKVEKAAVAASSKPVKSVNSTEIDDMFSLLNKKKVKIEDSKKDTPTELTITNEENDDSEFSDVDVFESATEAEAEAEAEDGEGGPVVKLVKGIPYDPKRDDFTISNSGENFAHDKDFFDSRGLKRKARPLTEDGLPIFTPKELKIGLGGGTDLCPFDCNCCF